MKKQMMNSNPDFGGISFIDLVKHTLLDKFEFSAHSLESMNGPYFWDGLGIDFMSSIPEEEVMTHVKQNNAKKIYFAHTHPLSNDDVCKFLNVEIDPREEIAFGQRSLPIGNPPSSGDVSYLSKLHKNYVQDDIEVVGVVFSSSCLWQFTINDIAHFDSKAFEVEYDKFFHVEKTIFFFGDPDELLAREIFPDYYMEVQKPKVRSNSYRIQATIHEDRIIESTAKDEIERIQNFYHSNGVSLVFHPYSEFDINPQHLMREVMLQWMDIFHGKK